MFLATRASNTFVHISSLTIFNVWPHKLHQALLLGQSEVICLTESLVCGKVTKMNHVLLIATNNKAEI